MKASVYTCLGLLSEGDVVYTEENLKRTIEVIELDTLENNRLYIRTCAGRYMYDIQGDKRIVFEGEKRYSFCSYSSADWIRIERQNPVLDNLLLLV